jgi:hypothetical protein
MYGPYRLVAPGFLSRLAAIPQLVEDQKAGGPTIGIRYSTFLETYDVGREWPIVGSRGCWLSWARVPREA